MNKGWMYLGSLIGGIGLGIVWWNTDTFLIPIGIWIMIFGNNIVTMYNVKKYK